MSELLTIKEIAKILKVAPSTVQYWRDKFPEFMPAVKVGRYPKYQPEAIEIFTIISDGYNNNLQQQEIAEMLRAKFPVNIGQSGRDKTTTTAVTVRQQRFYTVEMIEQDIKSRQELAAAIRELSEILKRRRGWLDIFRKGKH
jgi:DNA-binding transcriptional MerR regulator